ncbi:MAG: RNA-guided endonuclease InsQ/TnpB family protein [Mitsuokella sp.]|uniref:RNA-guided endonuclease InsQ/TnpB family protein n=1 Tax=Mitsuokella sp. TaxID=2049034 RepID=UPI003F0A85D6
MKAIKTQIVELRLTSEMRAYFDSLCDYRRYIWNQALAIWQMMYDIRSIMLPSELKQKLRQSHQDKSIALTSEEKELLRAYPAPCWQSVKKELLEDKADWETYRSARIVALTCMDLGKAWQNFFDKAQSDWGKPAFKSKKAPRQGFKSDRIKIVDGKIRFDKPRMLHHYLKEHHLGWWQDVTASETLKMTEVQTCSFFKEKGKYYAALTYQEETEPLPKTGKVNAVDVNVAHFDSLEGRAIILPDRLNRQYEKIAHYSRVLAKKRVVNGMVKGTQSKRYEKARTKLQHAYAKARNIQHDILSKYTTHLVKAYDEIAIENLNVKGMKMGIASKGVHRSLFGEFKRQMQYKATWYDRKLVLADQSYPSTQRCAACGHVKTGEERITLHGNQKHGTRHDQYICYECGYQNNRDANAVLNLLYLLRPSLVQTYIH